MDALVHWRHSSLRKRASGDTLRPISPPHSETPATDLQRQEQQFIDERSTREDHQYHGRSKSEPPSEFEKRQAEEDDKKAAMDSTGHNQVQGALKKPTSSSWVQWWSRSRQTKVLGSGNSQVLDPVRFLTAKGHFLLPFSFRHVTRQLHPSHYHLNSNHRSTRSRRLQLQTL
jgi:phosphatidate phosphatase LPIN